MSTAPTLSVLRAINTSPNTVDPVGLMVAQVHLQVHSHDGGKNGSRFFLQGVLARKMASVTFSPLSRDLKNLQVHMGCGDSLL